MDFTILGGVYGLIGSIIFIASMLYATIYYEYKGKIKPEELTKVVLSGLLPWTAFALILFLWK
jgi:hypothetical protein